MTAVQNIVIERTYRATVQEIWDLWTTKDGFESWWGPEGFRVEVHELDARVGGALRFDMIASSPEAIEGMKRIGQPPVVKTHGKFSELKPRATRADARDRLLSRRHAVREHHGRRAVSHREQRAHGRHAEPHA